MDVSRELILLLYVQLDVHKLTLITSLLDGDTIGPSIFILIVIVGIALTIHYINYTFLPPNPKLEVEQGVCVQRNLGSGHLMIEFAPNGLTVDEEKNELLIASVNEIVAIPDGIPLNSEQEGDATVLHNFGGGEDLVAITLLENGTVLAASEKSSSPSEKNTRSELITLQRQDDDGSLLPTMRYLVSTPSVGALAYVPDQFSEPKLLVAGVVSGNLGQNELRMDTIGTDFPVSFIDDPQQLVSSKMNDKVFGAGLLDSKVAAMQYFDGLLYLLFDKAQVIRAFDFNGNLVQETKLPVAAEGFEKEWEGMRFQRKGGELILHLVLKSPPQVWSIKLTEKSAGGWELPACAS